MLRPTNHKIREAILSGQLGKLSWAVAGAAFGSYHEGESVRTGDSPLTNINPSWYWLNRKSGGGPYLVQSLDLSLTHLDTAQFLIDLNQQGL